MNRSSMSKQMMQEGGPVVPSKEEFAAMTPEQQAARKKKAMMQNLNLSPEEIAEKEKMKKEVKGAPKKMNMGGMTAPMMPPKRKPAPRPIVDPKAKAPDPRMKDPRAKRGAMPMMKEGGNIPKYKAGKKVRGYGKARGGKACKMR